MAERRPVEAVAVATSQPVRSAPGLAERVAAATAGSTQAAWAVDWRFLLPDPTLGDVAVLGPVADALLAGLREVATGVSSDPAAGLFDTIVLGGHRPQARVARAARLAAPSSSVWVPRAPRRSRSALVRALRKAGFTEIALQWHRPRLDRPTLLVSLADGRAAAAVLDVVRSGPKRRVEALAARSGLAARLGSSVGLLASRGASTARPAAAAPVAGQPVDGLITPRFANSRTVVGVSVSKRRGWDRVAKVPRCVDAEAQLTHEAAALVAFGETGARATIPVHHLTRRADRLVLVETAASGRPLDPRRVRADRRAALRAGMDWLNAVPSGPASAPSSDGRRASLIDGAAQALRAADDGAGDLRAQAIDRTLEVLEPLASCPVPMVFEHGDLSHPNLFVRADGRLEVIDWERAVIRGLPLHDAYYYCGYLASALEQPDTSAELVDAYLRTAGTHGWARGALELHAEHQGVEPCLLGLLEVAAWFRATASLVRAGAAPGRAEAIWMARLVDLGRRRR